MALTLAEASKLSNDVLLQGVIETIVKESPILQVLPFIEIIGNGLTYNQENVLPDIGFYDVGDNWDESTPTFTQKTAYLKIMGGDADVDNFLKSTRSNVQDLEAAIIELKAKALKGKFENTFIYGDVGGGKQFDGLRKLIDTATAGPQVVAAGASGGTLTLSMLDQLVDTVRGGKPDLLLMSRRSRRKLNALIRASGSGLIETERDQWGNFVQYWDGIPVGISDWILDTHTVAGGVETATTGGNCSTIYALQMGEGGLCGLTAPGFITVEPIGSLESKDATRNRIKWYVSLALFSSIKAGALIGVQD
ncbi:MAG TPA: phage major capsid protein [Dehalococcoidales bacterium]|nr:phage major capsid protein [Dehalococcoidales bacterium]